MKRDGLFAEYVRNQSHELGYKKIIIDGTVSCDEVFHVVSQVFELEK